VDVTGILEIDENGFSFTPVQNLLPGAHTLDITVRTDDGGQAQQAFNFSTRHTEIFEEAALNADVSLSNDKKLTTAEEAQFSPSNKFESNLGADLNLNEQKWRFQSETNIRYLDQNLAVYPPVENGFNLANYLLQGSYEGEAVQVGTQLGDVQINETQNTVSLARRGGTFSVAHDLITLKTFMVDSEEIFGFKEGMGIGGSSDDHIIGVSGETGFFSDRLKFKTIYATGGEKGDSYSIYAGDGGDKEGEVLGFLLTSNFFENKLNTEAEVDFSEYDADTSDEFSDESDTSYRLKVEGLAGNYSYGALYEYLGADYSVIGNQYLQNNREGYTLNFGTYYQVHSASLIFSQYNDNVDDDELFPTVYTYQGQFSYNYSGFSSFPMGLSYQWSLLDSKDEPEYMLPMETATDTVTGMVNYINGLWNLGLQASYSNQNDKSSQNYDSDSMNYMFMTSYYAEHFSLSPSVSFNRSEFKPTGVKTDTTTTTLDFRGNLWDEKILYECAGTYSRMENDDDTVKTDSYYATMRLAYVLAKDLWGLTQPSAGVMGQYSETDDHISDMKTDDYTILFVFSTNIPMRL
jgi:hypothetical protein